MDKTPEEIVEDLMSDWHPMVSPHNRQRLIDTICEIIRHERNCARNQLEEFEQRMHQHWLEWRGIEIPCKKCGGSGVRCYANTSGWRGGIGGNAITTGMCDSCWGSGDAERSWLNLRKLENQNNSFKRMQSWIYKAAKYIPTMTQCQCQGEMDCDSCQLRREGRSILGVEEWEKAICKKATGVDLDD